MNEIEKIFEEFANLQQERVELATEILRNADDLDQLLADIVNLATLIYMARKAAEQKKGFVSFRKGNLN